LIVDFDSIPLTSAEDLLSKVSEKEIYEYYLGESIKEGRAYTCPFHKDNTPSLSFKLMPSGLLYHKCFGCGEGGSAINFVSKLKHLYSTRDAISLIQRDLNLGLGGPVSSSTTPRERVLNTGFTTEDNTVIIPVKQSFTLADYRYWQQYYISLNMLLKYNISSCKEVYIKRIKENSLALFAVYSNTNPIYCYEIGNKYKIYRPLNPTKSFKWLSTCKAIDIQGMEQLPSKGDLLIITSSMKDLLVLKLFGYNAIALGGEGNRISAKILDYLYACFNKIIVFYDNDEAGLKYGEKFASEIESNYIYIPTEYSDTKDISDFIKKYGKEQTGSLLKNLINDSK